MRVVACSLVAACAVATVPPPPPSVVAAPPGVILPLHELADGSHPTELQMQQLVGHYSTLDGKSGFIFDRTADPPLVLRDGDRFAVSVTVAANRRCCWDYAAAGMSLRVDRATGRITELIDDAHPDGAPVVRDADAEPLSFP